jgi:hypothetical protein
MYFGSDQEEHKLYTIDRAASAALFYQCASVRSCSGGQSEVLFALKSLQTEKYYTFCFKIKGGGFT